MDTDSFVYKLNNNEWIMVESHKKHVKENPNSNFKKMLCKNIIAKKKCPYGNKCVYAHKLSEQQIYPSRKTAYGMIINNINLRQYDISVDKGLCRALKSLTYLCNNCDTKKCTGGYNCKNGACCKNYVICAKDLESGMCNGSCGNVHLTKKGLIPIAKRIQTNSKNVDKIADDIDNDIVDDITTKSIFSVKFEDLLS